MELIVTNEYKVIRNGDVIYQESFFLFLFLIVTFCSSLLSFC